MKTESTDDLTLARQVAEGDEAALETFYTRYADPLFAFIYHHLDESRPDAEDIWQDTLLAALRALPTYRGRSRLFTWLCSIARHKIADHFRRQGRAAVYPFSDVPEGHLSEMVSSTALAEEVVAQRVTRVRVVEALASLSEDYRTALVARYADERSVSDVAHLLGRTYKATESLLSRARLAFQEALARLEGETA
jgi:RNA polymerase sigma-70 factor (ECF subfamily)